MSNRERGLFEGAIHHVWQRGNNKDYIFQDNNVTGKFIRDNLKRSGHVFQGRYNSKLVKSNYYLFKFDEFRGL